MDSLFEQGRLSDLDELEQLYNDINDYLAGGQNYPGWVKGVYPARQTAVDGIDERSLYVLRRNGRIAASAILRHKPEPAYHQVKWQIEADYQELFVIFTLVVHPAWIGHGVGAALMRFIIAHCKENMAKAIRLDVYERNQPAISLYKKFGFQYIGTVDLGLEDYGLKWFELYERLL